MSDFRLIRDFFRKKKKLVKRPLIIFESDDWGCIRMKSKELRDKLEKENSFWVSDPYLQFDSLETNEDLEIFFNLLRSFRDGDGKSVVITANCISRNPDFRAIRENGFQQFIGQDFRETYKEYPGCERSFSIQQKALEEGLWLPQFHGREHIHIKRWMQALSKGESGLLKAFSSGIISLKDKGGPPCVKYYMDAMNPDGNENQVEIVEIARDGLDCFKKTWGFASSTLIAPCYFWHSSLESSLQENGIKGFQGLSVQKQSLMLKSPKRFKKIHHRQADKNQAGQYYFVRNAFFEPSLDPSIDWVNTCLSQISKGLNSSGVAIVSTHRLNFIGSIEIANRERNLKLFSKLLAGIQQQFPDARFGTTVDLLNEIQLDSLIH